MKAKVGIAISVVSAVLLTAGCVERKMLIRSDPPGAPVWLDERYIGQTPVEQSFAFYGARCVRAGPIRDENDKVRYREVERIVEIEAPWFETFPMDFFFEVLYPFRLTDEHVLPVFELPRWDEGVQPSGAERVQEVREQAKEFRKKALYAIPEQAPPQ